MSSGTEDQGSAPRRRFPYGVGIACLVAGLLLILLLIPHVLLYPAQPEPPPAPDWQAELQALRQQNDQLAAEVKRLEELLGADVCRVPDGGLQLPDGTPVDPSKPKP